MSDSGPSDREAVLEIMADQIREIDERLDGLDPDLDDLEAQRMQIKWTRTLGYLAGQYRKLVKDRDIDELEEDVEMMREIHERTNP